MIYKFYYLEISEWTRPSIFLSGFLWWVNYLSIDLLKLFQSEESKPIKNSTIFMNKCTSKLENIMQSYDWRLEWPLLRFTPALVVKLITRSSNKVYLCRLKLKFQKNEFWKQRLELIYMTQFGMTEKNLKTYIFWNFWKHQC